MWPQMSQDPLNKKRKGGYIGLHLKYDSILFLLLPGWQIQCSGRDGKSNTYFDQDMQDFGGANLTFVQRMKQKSSNNIISETLQEREVEYVGTAFWECQGDKDCDSPLGMPRTNWIYRSLGVSRTRSPASKLTDGRECTISKAKYLSFMEWKIFDCKWVTNMKIKRGKKKTKKPCLGNYTADVKSHLHESSSSFKAVVDRANEAVRCLLCLTEINRQVQKM